MHLPFYNPSRINTPLKRGGYAAFWVGTALVASTLLAFGAIEFRPGYWGNFLYALFVGWPFEYFHDLLAYWGRLYRWLLVIGLVFTVAGYLLSYGHDRSVGRFVRWLRTGQ